jgi:hypothetical protein
MDRTSEWIFQAAVSDGSRMQKQGLILLFVLQVQTAAVILHAFTSIDTGVLLPLELQPLVFSGSTAPPFLQVCGKPVTTNTGKCLRPEDNARIILFLKDINLPR